MSDILKNEKTAKANRAIRAGFSSASHKTMKANKLKFIAVGSKGTAGVLCDIPDTISIDKPLTMAWDNTSERGSSNLAVCIAHSKGKPSGFLCYDIGCYVSERGEKFSVLPIAQAIKSGIVFAHKANITRDGKTVSVTVYPKKGYNIAEKQPRVLACDGIPALRIEPMGKTVSSDKRNVSLLWKLETTPKAPKAPKAPKGKKPVTK